MEATVAHFRQGRHHQNTNQNIIETGLDVEKAKELIGKTVTWKSPAGKEITGKVSALHGRKGAIRAIFAEKGLPGQALGTKVQIN